MLLVLGVAATVGAAYLGERDLLWLALTLALLPLLAAGYLVLARPRVSHDRTLTPATIPVGTSTRAVLHVANQSPAQASALRFVDDAPAVLGGGASFVIARGFGHLDLRRRIGNAERRIDLVRIRLLVAPACEQRVAAQRVLQLGRDSGRTLRTQGMFPGRTGLVGFGQSDQIAGAHAASIRR